MFKESYIIENNAFALSEDFKFKTIALLEQKQSEKSRKTVKFPAKIAVAAAIALCVGLGMLAYSPKPVTQPQVFTVADAQPLTEQPGLPETVYQWNAAVMGGMGYEGMLFKDITEYDNGNPYKITDSFSSLPVYRYRNLNLEDVVLIRESIMSALGKTNGDIVEESYTCTEFVYIDGHLASHKDYTYNILIEDYEENSQIHLPMQSGEDKLLCPWTYYDLSFEDMTLRITLLGGSMHISLDCDLDPDSHSELLSYLEENLALTLDIKNPVAVADIDYNIYGEESPSYYLYSGSDDYADNIFNYSVNRGNAAYLTAEESLEDSDYISLWQNIAEYEKGEELPAISYSEALGLLYRGQYFSSAPYEITEDSIVSRIELVYKEPPYDSMNLKRSELSLPFYKFFVEIDEMGIKEHGLKDYGIYYVCAIHPDYVEITEDYTAFN